MSFRPPSGKSRIQQGGLLRWWLEPYEFELQARGHSAGPASQRGQQQGLARGSLPPPMLGVLRLKGGQLASALVRPRRLREPGSTSTQGLRTVPGDVKGAAPAVLNQPTGMSRPLMRPLQWRELQRGAERTRASRATWIRTSRSTSGNRRRAAAEARTSASGRCSSTKCPATMKLAGRRQARWPVG